MVFGYRNKKHKKNTDIFAQFRQQQVEPQQVEPLEQVEPQQEKPKPKKPKEKVLCSCGSCVSNLSTHMKTAKHKKWEETQKPKEKSNTYIVNHHHHYH
jgi:hypothetical protein